MGPPAVVFKKIQGGIQPDISLRLTGNFPWSLVSIVLRPYGGTSNKQFPFRAEMKYGSKQWSKRCKNCLVRAWQHKRYTNVRIQFCRDYYGVPLQFIAQAETLCAATTTPIVTFKPVANGTRRGMDSGVPTTVKWPKKKKRKRTNTHPASIDSAMLKRVTEQTAKLCAPQNKRPPRPPRLDEQQSEQPQITHTKIHKKTHKKTHSATAAAHAEKQKKITQSTTVSASKRRRFSPLKYLLATQMCLLQSAQATIDDWDQENSVVSLLTRRGIHGKGSPCWRPPFRVLGHQDRGLAHSSLQQSMGALSAVDDHDTCD